MRLPKMTMRRWIATVGISGALLGVVVEVDRELRLASQYRLKAQLHGREESFEAKGGFRSVASQSGAGSFRNLASKLGTAGSFTFSLPNPKLAEYHKRMRLKYESAAAQPWKSLELDTTEP